MNIISVFVVRLLAIHAFQDNDIELMVAQPAWLRQALRFAEP